MFPGAACQIGIALASKNHSENVKYVTGRSKRSPRNEGVTLIEVMVVVAIGSAAMSLVLASADNVRQHAKLTVCKANIRSQIQAHSTFAVDNNDVKPMAAFYRADGTLFCDSWMTNLLKVYGRPYAQGHLVAEGYLTLDVMTCPTSIVGADSQVGFDEAEMWVSSYVYLWWLPQSVEEISKTPNRITYDGASDRDENAMIMDFNLEYPNDVVVTNHPQIEQCNVGFIRYGGHVSSCDSSDISLPVDDELLMIEAWRTADEHGR